MQLFMRGGWMPCPGYYNDAGLPTRRPFGPFYFRFPVSERMTLYEWVMVATGRHPYAYPLASWHCEGDLSLLKEDTIAGMKARLHVIDSDEETAGLYRDLIRAIDAGRTDPLRTERCRPRPGMPQPLDPTRYLFDFARVWPVIEGRGIPHRLIAKLAAEKQCEAAAQGRALPLGIRTNHAANAEDACREYLRKLDPSQRPKNKEAAYKEAERAVAHIGPLSGKAFDRAWRSDAPQDWHEPGTRKKSP